MKQSDISVMLSRLELDCSRDGKDVDHGQSDYFYSNRTANNCNASSVRRSLTCDNGDLGFPVYRYSDCKNNCRLSDGSYLQHGTSRQFWKDSPVPNCESPVTRSCNDGTLE